MKQGMRCNIFILEYVTKEYFLLHYSIFRETLKQRFQIYISNEFECIYTLSVILKEWPIWILSTWQQYVNFEITPEAMDLDNHRE